MVLSCKCHDTIVIGITDSFITSTRHHYLSFFLFYMFLCMFVHPLIYIIKWSKAPYQQKTEAPSSSVNNNNNIIYNNFRNTSIIYVFNTKCLNQTKLQYYNTVQYNITLHHCITLLLHNSILWIRHRPSRHVSTGCSVQ